uniref:Uncharacterized protein n=1 Tax=Rhizophora mucronata TaxID=61149 RepID=A0A2P2NRX1_RHIMU
MHLARFVEGICDAPVHHNMRNVVFVIGAGSAFCGSCNFVC